MGANAEVLNNLCFVLGPLLTIRDLVNIPGTVGRQGQQLPAHLLWGEGA